MKGQEDGLNRNIARPADTTRLSDHSQPNGRSSPRRGSNALWLQAAPLTGRVAELDR